MSPKIKAQIGERFERLVITHVFRKDRITYCHCLCDCGVRKILRYGNLQTGNTVSCGCFHKESISQRSRKPPGVAIINQIWNYYKRNARLRKLCWELSKETFTKLIFGDCKYCGIEPCTITKTKYNDQIKNNGIDRIDSNVGYTSTNTVPCCKVCNLAKNNLSYEQFVIWATRLVRNLEHGYMAD